MNAEVFDTPDAAVADISDGATILVGGFVSAGTPSNLILALKRGGQTGLTAVLTTLGWAICWTSFARSGNCRR